MNMMDVLRKTMMLGLGAAALSAEKLRQLADEMVAKGEISEGEAKKFVDEVQQKAEEEKKSMQSWINEQISKVLQQAGAAEATRVNDLEQKVALLERRLIQLETETKMIVTPTCEVVPTPSGTDESTCCSEEE